MRNFIAIRAETLNDVLRYIGTSSEMFCHSEKEIKTKEAIDFLHSLSILKGRKETKNPVYIWYAAHLEVERMLRYLPKKSKDIAFPSETTNKKKKTLSNLIKSYRRLKRSKITGERIAELKAQLHALEYIYYRGYRLRVRAGKSLTIYKLDENNKPKSGLTIFDICHFFGKDNRNNVEDINTVAEVSRRFLGYSLPELNRERKEELSLWEGEAKRTELIRTVEYVNAETQTLVKLAEKLSDYLEEVGVTLRRWYGPSSVVNYLFNQWNVRREYRQLSTENTPRALMHAIDCATHGGRIETLKLGMIPDPEIVYDAEMTPGVFVYDIRSAYAYAAALLSKLTGSWRYTKEYNIYEPFALWRVEYDLPSSSYVGLLPHRRAGNSICYPRSGRGWYFSPEVRELTRRYGVHCRVRDGYILPYINIGFGGRIRELYQHRRELIRREGKGKGEKIFKSILHNIYGKFAQVVGESPFQCLTWAGWITSFVRAQMLETIAGQEQDVICFHTDAIHAMKPLVTAHVSEELGEWECKYYPYGFFMASGVHCYYDEERNVIESATRGFEFIDWNDAIAQLNNPLNFGSVTLTREFFAGYQYAEQFPVRGNYLTKVEERLTHAPLRTKSRDYAASIDEKLGKVYPHFDWSRNWVDSKIIDLAATKESAPRRDTDWSKRLNKMLDIIQARR